MKKRVLFVGIHNDARSQMAEAFLNAALPARFEAYSAGLQPAPLNPLMIEAMREIGFDVSKNKSTSAFDSIKRDDRFDFVITVCDDAGGEHCPVFPESPIRLHWGFANPASYQGEHEEKLAFMRHIRDEIKDQVNYWCAEQRHASGNLLEAKKTSRGSQRISATV